MDGGQIVDASRMFGAFSGMSTTPIAVEKDMNCSSVWLTRVMKQVEWSAEKQYKSRSGHKILP